MSRIIIVDDDLDILKFCKTVLSPLGHEVVVRSEAEAALATLRQHRVDLLVVDVVMPVMNGYDLLREVKRIKEFKSPILMLTHKSAPKDVSTALELGATDYMIKPFDKDVFLAKVDSLLGKVGGTPEVQFPEGSANAAAEITVPAIISSITEMGMYVQTPNYVDSNLRIRVNSALFREIGINCPPMRAVSCKAIETNSDYHYEVFVSFIGADENTMQRIRRWIANRALTLRKAG